MSEEAQREPILVIGSSQDKSHHFYLTGTASKEPEQPVQPHHNASLYSLILNSKQYKVKYLSSGMV